MVFFLSKFILFFLVSVQRCDYAKISQSAESMEEYENLIRHMFESASGVQPLICCLENEGKLKVIGVSLMQLCTMEESLKEFRGLNAMFKTKQMVKYVNIVADFISEEHTVMKEYLSQKLYVGRGIMVHRDFRKLGICTELLRIRRMICKEHKVPLTSAWMSAYGTQKAAATDGWETIKEIKFNELGQKHDVQFVNVPEVTKLMVAWIK